MRQDIRFGSLVLPADRPFIIAEAGVNYENRLDTAFRMIEAAADNGADAIKFQSYKAETLAARNSPAYWDVTVAPATSQYEFFKNYDHFGDREYEQLARHAESCGIQFMSTPFDLHFADMLAPLMPAYKIASADITNIPFLQYCARKGKPIILSVGASTQDEVHQAVRAIHGAGNHQIALLHCVLSYPCRPDDAHLNTIPYLAQRFPGVPIGYSDHVPPDDGMLVPVTAWLLGARIVEKHFTLDRTQPSNDHFHSMDPAGLRRLRETCAYLAPALGDETKAVWPCEAESRRQARRSLVAARAIRRGETATGEALTTKRPGTGIAPTELASLVGRTALRDIDEDEILQWDMFSAAKGQ